MVSLGDCVAYIVSDMNKMVKLLIALTINCQPSLIQLNSNKVSHSHFFNEHLEASRCSVFCKPTSASCVLRYTQKDISLLFKRIGLSSQATARFKLIPRIRSRSLTDNLCPLIYAFICSSLQSLRHPRGTQGAD